ncbi:hypothetical protein HY496_01805 [Candidatus Woesearchaeota archaeon]|nr:hypothetical protein [Candidatus Woesearchaeota archaeon]
MPRPRFKQRCALCKKNMVVMYTSRQFPICVECHMKRISDPVTDPKYKEMFNIPRDFYEKSMFLRNIKESFQRFGSLTENQVTAFKKAVDDLKNPKKKKEDQETESPETTTK